LPFLSPTAADGFSNNFCVAPHEGAGRGLKLALVGRWTRIISQTYFQQHAGQRMTPKTVKSSRNPINRAHLEQIGAGFAALKGWSFLTALNVNICIG
jgi:hypothetical protein